MLLGMEVGLGPDHIVLYRDPADAQKGGIAPNFRHVFCGQNGWIDQDATWYGGKLKPRPRRHCVRGDPGSLSPKGGQSFNFRSMSIVGKRLYASRCHLVRR